MKMILKNVSNGFRNLLSNTYEFLNLKHEIKYLKKELEESKNKEKPYIDKINSLKSQLRICKIINGQLEKELRKKSS